MVSHVDAVQMPPRVSKDPIVATAGMCETLSHGIEALQASLKRLDGIVCRIDDASTCEALQHQIKQMQASLMLDLVELSGIKHTMQAASTCKHQPVF